MSTDEKPSRNEDEYFLKLDQELLKAQRAKRELERAEMERRQHFMKCPKCGYDMVEKDMSGITIDECTHCRGIFFDAGEIELLRRDKGGLGHFFTGVFGKRTK
jgi:hypothetical protein